MSKFKVGDLVRLSKTSRFYRDGGNQLNDNIGTVEKVGHWINVVWINGINREFRNAYLVQDLLLASSKGEQTMGRRTYRLIKELPGLKKGAVLQEQCDDGDQPYELLDKGYFKHDDQSAELYSRMTVENEPKFFEEVFPLVPEYGNKAELEAFKKFAKKRK